MGTTSVFRKSEKLKNFLWAYNCPPGYNYVDRLNKCVNNEGRFVDIAIPGKNTSSVKPTSKNTAKSIVILILLLICCAAMTYLTISLRRNRIEEPIGEATTPANTKKKDVIIEENTGRRRINLKR